MGIWIHISTSRHQLKLFDGSQLLKTYPIGVGKMLTPTPAGTYTIINKDPNPGGPFGYHPEFQLELAWSFKDDSKHKLLT